MSQSDIEQGQDPYARYCLLCHGVAAISGGVLPDLRHSSKAVHDLWLPIVIGELYQDRGMASFADLISAEEAEKIHAYVVHEGQKIAL